MENTQFSPQVYCSCISYEEQEPNSFQNSTFHTHRCLVTCMHKVGCPHRSPPGSGQHKTTSSLPRREKDSKDACRFGPWSFCTHSLLPVAKTRGHAHAPRPVVGLVVSWPDDPQTTVQLWHHGSPEASSMVRVTGDSHCFPGIAPKGLHQAQNHSHPAFILRKWWR